MYVLQTKTRKINTITLNVSEIIEKQDVNRQKLLIPYLIFRVSFNYKVRY